ncbi:MAG: sodium/proton-translocating pyrophosphatase, partial [Alphaproteobacteria bacterium]|nr:sodium/proton-translocating pyrophosphatase [Alphaproteobacteria bacterium]
MSNVSIFVIACGLLAPAYSVYAIRSVLAAPAGTERMGEIAAAIQEGARAYLNRQYTAIALVGAVIGVLLGLRLGLAVAIGYFVGAILSAAAGYIGMNVSVRANVRTAEAARTRGLDTALGLAFKSGAVTGMLVVGLALLGVTVYYVILRGMTDTSSAEGMRHLLEALVALGFGASLISI